MFQFKTAQWMPVTMEIAWDFFSSPENLALITPPEMNFKIIAKPEGNKISEGMIIDYKVRPLFGIPMKWETQILDIKDSQYFTDIQLKGPYKLWRHTHIFFPKNNGVWMEDEVIYELPLGIIGKIAHALIVRKKIENIFKYRQKVINNLFPVNE